ncbi:MAG: OmpA family protein [Bacteroidota bacterium]
MGGLDVFGISLDENGVFEKVTNLRKPINSSKDDFGFIMDEEKQIGYLSSNRDGDAGSASDDIYRVWERCGVIIINGLVTDLDTGTPLQASIVTLLDDTNIEIGKMKPNAKGYFVFKDSLDCGKRYALRAETTDNSYVPVEKRILTPRGTHTLEVNLELTPTDCPNDDLGCRLNLQPIYFDYGKYTIRKDAEVELAKILEAMKTYPEIKIHIESHTDSRSSSEFNKKLSSRRAYYTMEWFVKNGIDRSRLSSKGYGESQLLNQCENGIKCSEEEHQLNRRSVFLLRE